MQPLFRTYGGTLSLAGTVDKDNAIMDQHCRTMKAEPATKYISLELGPSPYLFDDELEQIAGLYRALRRVQEADGASKYMLHALKLLNFAAAGLGIFPLSRLLLMRVNSLQVNCPTSLLLQLISTLVYPEIRVYRETNITLPAGGQPTSSFVLHSFASRRSDGFYDGLGFTSNYFIDSETTLCQLFAVWVTVLTLTYRRRSEEWLRTAGTKPSLPHAHSQSAFLRECIKYSRRLVALAHDNLSYMLLVTFFIQMTDSGKASDPTAVLSFMVAALVLIYYALYVLTEAALVNRHLKKITLAVAAWAEKWIDIEWATNDLAGARY